MNARDLRVGLVGPLPPPSGGMANQTRQLARLLGQEGVTVELVQMNAPYRPAWIERVWGVRALFRLAPYLLRLWNVAGRVHLFHVMANSGWAWHLFAAPAIWIAKVRGVGVVVNYRGGGAEDFFKASFFRVGPTMRMADRLIVPSGFLQDVFKRFGLSAEVVPNIIDLGRFRPRVAGDRQDARVLRLLVTRNLEPLYDIGTAIRALALVRKVHPEARLTIAGSGPELGNLESLAQSMGVAGHVTFTGRLDNERIAELYLQSDITLNPSLVDNMPISILESLASGIPVVSTNVGGVPFVVEDRRTALLVSAGDAEAMGRAVLDLAGDPRAAAEMARAGRESVQQYTWPKVWPLLLAVYLGIVDCVRPAAETGIK